MASNELNLCTKGDDYQRPSDKIFDALSVENTSDDLPADVIQSKFCGEVPTPARQIDTIYCEPCKEDGKFQPVEGFCVNCTEFLCTDCFKYHRKQKTFRNHVLMDKSEMTRDRLMITMKDVCVTKCEGHPDKVIEYFCAGCDKIGCSVCMTLYHRACNNVDLISKYVETRYREHSKYSFEDFELCNDIASALKRNKERLMIYKGKTEKWKRNTIETIKETRGEINKLFDFLECQTIDTVENTCSEEEKRLQSIDEQCMKLSQELQLLTVDFDQKENSGRLCELFIALQQAKLKIQYILSGLTNLTERNIENEYKFEISSNILYMLSSIKDFGNLTSTFSETKNACFVKNVPFSTRNGIRGICAFSENILIAVGEIETRSFDIESSKVLSDVSVAGGFGISKVDDNQVVLPLCCNMGLQLLNVSKSGTITVEEKIHINEPWCHHVTVFGNCIIYSDPRAGLRVCDKSGKLLRILEKDKAGNTIFQSLTHITANPVKSLLYAAGPGIHSVTCFTIEGEVKAVNNNFASSQGHAVDEAGNVYVCDTAANEIVQLRGDLSNKSILLDKKDGIYKPRTIAFCDSTKRLFVEMYDVIKIFRIQ